MLECGIEVIRVAEFSWSKVEPAEGNFTFDFWDDFLDLSEKLGMKVIFCIPTATPPAWLTERSGGARCGYSGKSVPPSNQKALQL